jgi:CheY-like chemotaxis protein
MNRKKILIVDDSPIILKTVSAKLTLHGYHALTARDGGEAISTVRRERPDLILLEISFPPDVAHGGGVAWDGFLIMDWLRRMDEGKTIPIIIITGGDPIKYEHRSLAAGAVAFFHKPIDNAALLEIIHQTLGDPEPEVCLSV